MFKVRDVLIAHLLARGVPQEDVSRLHGWSIGLFWRAYSLAAGLSLPELPGGNRRVRKQIANQEKNAARGDFDWMITAHVFRVPFSKNDVQKRKPRPLVVETQPESRVEPEGLIATPASSDILRPPEGRAARRTMKRPRSSIERGTLPTANRAATSSI